MGVFDKLKNALFEVEYVEVEEKQKKEKPIKSKEKIKETEEDRPIAKKIVLPGKREEKVEEIKEEEMKDDNFEIRPLNETVKEKAPTFKFMDDDDFTVDENIPSVMDNNVNNFDYDDYSNQNYSSESIGRRSDRNYNRPIHASEVQNNRQVQDEVQYDRSIHASEVQNNRQVQDEVQYDRPIHANSFDSYDDVEEKRESYKESFQNDYYDRQEATSESVRDVREKENKPYGVDSTTFKAAKEYGTYENKDEKSYFKPSPIISPIYGILDKNYKKEDVVSKKEIRITTNYSRTNLNVDDIRNKAYGRRSTVEQEIVTPSVKNQEPSFEVDDDEEDNLLVDLSDEKEKPEVKSITVGDAVEYFDDLGLEYNVDYVDATSRNKKRSNDLEEDIKNTMVNEVKPVDLVETHTDPPKIIHSDAVGVENKKTVEVRKESNNTEDDEDNLFDLIDSMYKEDD